MGLVDCAGRALETIHAWHVETIELEPHASR
jgi:hypothetical protein